MARLPRSGVRRDRGGRESDRRVPVSVVHEFTVAIVDRGHLGTLWQSRDLDAELAASWQEADIASAVRSANTIGSSLRASRCPRDVSIR